MVNNISLLGSTGSIGQQTLDVCRSLSIPVKYLACQQNIDLLTEQIREFKPLAVSVGNVEAAKSLSDILKENSEYKPEILFGEEGLAQISSQKVDRAVIAMSGFAALAPVYQNILSGNDLALANKEAMVVAGSALKAKAKERGIKIYPVDSEHSAIWQCLAAAGENRCRKVYLTASGGPFREYSLEQLRQVTPQQALQHPVWNMGAKISIDSATMMNKGLEIIEAMELFDLEEEQIEVLVHPQGIVHSLVEFEDAAILGQLSYPDMRLPIQLALTWPERVDGHLPKFDFFAEEKSCHLDFYPPDTERFPALILAREAAREGGYMPLVYNSANEVAVSKFLKGELSFLGISALVASALEHFSGSWQLTDFDLNAIIESDKSIKYWSLDFSETF